MKLAIAAFGTAMILATGASAMVGPYERAVNDPANAQLFTSGMEGFGPASDSASPQAVWSNGKAAEVTVFSTKNTTTSANQLGAYSR